MNNAVLMLAHNCLELTKRAVESVRQQDIPTELLVIDNDSRDGTLDWLIDNRIDHFTFRPQLGVSEGWNVGLRFLFRQHDHVLVLNNDVELPPWFLRSLLNTIDRYSDVTPPVQFVTGVAVDTRPDSPPAPTPLTPNPDFSAFLICKSAWDAIGEFDADMKFYCSDCSYHVRGHRLGVPMMKANVPFYHQRSSTMNLASPEERAAIQAQADSDRQVFRDIYGCIPGEAAYDELFRNR